MTEPASPFAPSASPDAAAATTPEAAPRLPEGQHLVRDFPVLSFGPTPAVDLATWSLRVWGRIDSERTLTWEQFLALPQTTLTTDFHCVTTWSQYDMVWQGVRFTDLLSALGVELDPSCTHVVQHAEGGYTTNNALAVLLDDDVILAHMWNGAPLTPDHGWPLRVVVPKRYAWKGAKWLTGLEFLDHDERGFWETHGYHNLADPWQDERFSHQE